MPETTQTPVVFQAQGQAPDTATQVEQEQGKTTPEYITKEEAKALADAAAQDALRKAQSLFDKGRDGILKRVQADLQALEKGFELQSKAGVPVTAEQRDAAKQKVIAAAMLEGELEPTPTAQAPQPGAPQQTSEAPDPVTAEAWQMMQAAGVAIEEGDPEFTTIDRSSALNFLKSIQTAIEAKRTRLNPTPAEARIPGPAGGAATQPASPYTGLTPYQLFEKAYQQKRR